MEILELTREKGKLFRLLLDDGQQLWLHADLVAEEGLCRGDSLDAEQIAALKYKAAEHRAFEYALYLLERRGFSYRELYDKLMGAKNAQEDAVEAALERLTRIGLLDDARYAQQLARHYVEGKRYGIRRAAFEMKRHGLTQNDVDDALAEYDDPERISAMLLELLQKKYARYLTDPDDRKSVEKVTAALVRRGFTFQQVRYALEDYDAWAAEQRDADI